MSFTSKNFFSLLLVAVITSLTFSSCKDDDDQFFENPNITEDITWAGDEIHTLSGRVIVTNGATLTIEPGAIIKAESKPNDEASVLIIATDGKIQANGTADNPIIFTSINDDIEIGQLTGTNLGETDTGFWGGVIILGEAPISPEAGAIARIEGLPANIIEAEYGGNLPEHSSGSFTYVSIRHAGIALEPDKEINGLTLGGVGSGTTINNVEIIANFDDGIEFFGGTVNVNNAAVLYQGDDGFDIDQAYSGTLENIIYIGSAANESDNALEIDGPEGDQNTDGAFTIRKGSLTGSADDYAHLKSNAQGSVQDLYFFGLPENGKVEILGGVATDNFQNGTLEVRGCTFNSFRTLQEISTTDQDGMEDTIDNIFANSTENTITSTPETSADINAFTGWTWADAKGLLSTFE